MPNQSISNQSIEFRVLSDGNLKMMGDRQTITTVTGTANKFYGFPNIRTRQLTNYSSIIFNDTPFVFECHRVRCPSATQIELPLFRWIWHASYANKLKVYSFDVEWPGQSASSNFIIASTAAATAALLYRQDIRQTNGRISDWAYTNRKLVINNNSFC